MRAKKMTETQFNEAKEKIQRYFLPGKQVC